MAIHDLNLAARYADRVLLLHQGALSFEIWFGREAPLAEMRAALLDHAASR